MEDAHLADVHPHLAEGVFAVFDGHGGAEVARFCERHLAPAVKAHDGWVDAADVPRALVDCFHAMDDKLVSADHAAELAALRAPPRGGAGPLALVPRPDENRAPTGNSPPAPPPPPAPPSGEPPTAGCTAVVAAVVRATLVVANAGDSRAVLADGDGVAVPLSDDHKPGAPGESARIHAAGGFVSCIGGVTRVNGNLSLSRAIGDLQYKQNGALGRHEQVVTVQPDVVVRALAPGDAFLLLACDGVWDVLDRQAAVDVVRERLDAGETAAAAAVALLDACLSPDPRATRGAGCDNMTALVVLLPSRRR